MSYDALRRGHYSLPQQIYCITTVTRDRCQAEMPLSRMSLPPAARGDSDGAAG